MFILDSKEIPTTAGQLTAAITASLRRSIKLAPGTPVELTGDLPDLSAMTVDVSNGNIDSNQPLPDPTAPDKTDPGPIARTFTIIGHPISVEGIPLQFDLSATAVKFAYARNAADQLIVTLDDATNGQLAVALTHKDLEAAILTIARKVAASSGVAVQSVSATVTSVNPGTVDVVLDLVAKKFVTAKVRISGRLSVDGEMTALATNLKADADGMVGSIAVNLIRPQLKKMENQPLPLLAFSRGKVKLRSINVDTRDGVRVAAQFGSV